MKEKPLRATVTIRFHRTRIEAKIQNGKRVGAYRAPLGEEGKVFRWVKKSLREFRKKARLIQKR